MSYPEKRIARVLTIIEKHSMSIWEKLGSFEEKDVWDADKVDELGEVGLSRAFYMRGETGLPLYDLN
ncbi:hypothetical protein HN807_06005 [Candidatus Bathyarchaeota archaeon]|jgi:hypothetical protein|nr:hypothetical protein [Candidatus Bathyarchaeota archaeon]MBT4319161.1 hypothetical protein [Candidatus Bathyarchaeota archaeon]MBT4423425.1 hypothetical protein [Candidatus Bathyarchaeota archaeon]MBT6605381.1 hypothetical protein [Candidatus Bathyarchaeota archaeon]MBT7186244.1 hypothetical protein [Candidatus Bathyarchaeota archaeon]